MRVIEKLNLDLYNFTTLVTLDESKQIESPDLPCWACVGFA